MSSLCCWSASASGRQMTPSGRSDSAWTVSSFEKMNCAETCSSPLSSSSRSPASICDAGVKLSKLSCLRSPNLHVSILRVGAGVFWYVSQAVFWRSWNHCGASGSIGGCCDVMLGISKVCMLL